MTPPPHNPPPAPPPSTGGPDDRRGWSRAALTRVLVIAAWSVREVLRTAWHLIRQPILFALQIVAALIVLFEEWGWKPLSDLLGWLARFKLIAVLERWIAGLPPYAALVVFALPTTLLLPLKLVAMWLLAKGQVMAAGGLFVGAKIASTALVARIFMLTKPALLRLAWFNRAYSWFIPWKDHLFALIRASWVWRYGRMVKTRVRLDAKRLWTVWRPRALAFVSRVRELLRPFLAAARTALAALLAGLGLGRRRP
ncbi:MAG: hypothetical protein ACRCS9_01820 [Hyphomicrobium sp.]